MTYMQDPAGGKTAYLYSLSSTASQELSANSHARAFTTSPGELATLTLSAAHLGLPGRSRTTWAALLGAVGQHLQSLEPAQLSQVCGGSCAAAPNTSATDMLPQPKGHHC